MTVPTVRALGAIAALQASKKPDPHPIPHDGPKRLKPASLKPTKMQLTALKPKR